MTTADTPGAQKGWHIAHDRIAAGPAGGGDRWVEALARGSMLCGLYAPRGHDPQGPHTRDELYIVKSGNARFVRGGEAVDCGEGDLLFVPAGMDHRFSEMSNDFAAWVVFWGPEGGEGVGGNAKGEA